MTGKNQLSLEFPHRPYMGREDFIVSSCNAEAFAAVDRWPEWPFFALCVYGPENCGKTHLTHIFSDKVSVLTHYPYQIPRIEAGKITLELPPLLFERHRCLVVENLNEEINEEAMFHLYNLYRNEGGSILFTSRRAPARLDIRLPDLRSRLNIIPSIEISEPDDELLSALKSVFICELKIGGRRESQICGTSIILRFVKIRNFLGYFRYFPYICSM